MLTPTQQHAIDRATAWLRGPNAATQPFRLFGYAGTGKTTIARVLGSMSDGLVLFGAYTGKAALVLRECGCNAQTIHKLIYRPKDKSRLHLIRLQQRLEKTTDEVQRLILAAEIREEQENLRRPSFSLNLESAVKDAELVIIDEVSMVGRRMGEDLLSFMRPILVLGDPAQLPPVGDGGFFTNQKPDVLLTEIHRQAQDSPVLKLATHVREHGAVPDHIGPLGGRSAIVRKGTLKLPDVAAFDQVLVGRNATRKTINRRIRTEHLGRKGHLPEPGDKLVCLRNDSNAGLLNGEQWYCLSCEVIDSDLMALTIGETPEGAGKTTVEAHRHTFEDREIPHNEIRKAQQFDYAWAMTVHKAQGSQWQNVLVIDESAAFGASARNHLYTAVTRASHDVTVVVS